jgi:hypothetical protein
MTDAGHNLASRVHGFNGGLEWSITNKVDCCSMSPRHKQGIEISKKRKRVKFDGMGKIFNGFGIQHEFFGDFGKEGFCHGAGINRDGTSRE